MASQQSLISVHVLDMAKGAPAKDIPVTLYKRIGNEWSQKAQKTTNNDGRISELTETSWFTSGHYKLRFDVQDYFERNIQQTFYPFIEISVICDAGEKYHVPLLLSPFGYTTYRGS